MAISKSPKTLLKSYQVEFGNPLPKLKPKKPKQKPQGALHEARALTKLKQESLKLAQKVNADLIIENTALEEERDYWMFKKKPRGFFNKLMYVIRN